MAKKTEKQIESYNSHIAHSVRSVFPPSWSEVILYFLSSLIVLSALNYHVFTASISTRSGIGTSSLNDYLHQKLNTSSDFISRLLQGRVASILFWAFLGSVIYMAVWIIQNVIINFENDIQAGEFTGVNNSSTQRKAYWHSIISSKVFFGCTLIALVIYAISLIKFFIPLTSKAFGIAISNSAFPRGLISGILTILATALLFYLLILALRTVAHTWRWIIGNF